jgi:hypothetical protein
VHYLSAAPRIFVNCNWVDTRWQQYSTHLHTNNTYNNIINFGRVRAVPRLCELYPGICLTSEGKARKNLSQSSRRVPAGTMKTILDNDLVCPFKTSGTNTPVTKCNNPEDPNHQSCGHHPACGTEHNSTLHYHRNLRRQSNGSFKLYN